MLAVTNQITLRTATLIPFVMIFLLSVGVMIYVQQQSYEAVVADISNITVGVNRQCP